MKSKIGADVANVTRDSDTTLKVKAKGHCKILINKFISVTSLKPDNDGETVEIRRLLKCNEPITNQRTQQRTISQSTNQCNTENNETVNKQQIYTSVSQLC